MNRIDKVLSHHGLGSRKDIKKILRANDVLVNGQRVLDASFTIDEEHDLVTINDEVINLCGDVYLMMNKIAGTVSSTKDGEHATVFQLLDEKYKTPFLETHLHIVGRLDMDTEGLLLFTTDGTLTHKMISPKSHISKKYFVCLERAFSDDEKKQTEDKFMKGIHIPREDNEAEADCLPAQVEWCTKEQEKEFCINSSKNPNEIIQSVLLTIYEGKYHQVKRMFLACQNKVVYLKRISIGNLILDKNLLLGKTKDFLPEEINL